MQGLLVRHANLCVEQFFEVFQPALVSLAVVTREGTILLAHRGSRALFETSEALDKAVQHACVIGGCGSGSLFRNVNDPLNTITTNGQAHLRLTTFQ